MDPEISLHLPLYVAVPLVVLCLALGAYMSAAETAVTGASRPRMHRLAQQGSKRAVVVNRLPNRITMILAPLVAAALGAAASAVGDRDKARPQRRKALDARP